MKRLFFIVSIATLFSILLAACTSKTAITPTAHATQVVAASPVNTATLVAISTATTSAPAPVVFTKPVVALDSTYRYIDGTLLDAVPAGPFTMGRKGGSDNPEHTVTLSDFWIYSTKVTNRQYDRCVSAGLCTPSSITTDSSQFDNPVTGVNWDQAQTYCTYVLGRLPTEAEWEKAARGPSGNTYPWGNDQPTCNILNFNGCVGSTTKVTTYPQDQSYYHLLDMEGNAFEWVADWYGATYYKNSPSNDPQGPNTGNQRVARSSGYRSTIDSMPASVRSPFTPDASESDLGFRCVVDDPFAAAPACEQISTYGPPPTNNSQSVQKNIPATCPTLGLVVAQQMCSSNSTYVTFTSNTPGQTTISGVNNCTQLLGTLDSYPQVYKCQANTIATISSTCTYSGLGNAYCGDHYKLDPTTGTCKWDGSSGLGSQCLTGTNFDSANSCCATTLGGKYTYPLCAVGTTLVDFGNGKYGCVTISSIKTIAPISKEVIMPASCK